MTGDSSNIYPLCSLTYDLLEEIYTSKPKLAFDCGANFGGMARTLAQKCAIVHAFEPVPEMFKKLQDMAWGHRNIVPFQMGVSDIESVLEGVRVFNAWTLLPEGDEEGFNSDFEAFDMRVTTIDAHSSVFGLPDFLKLDVDGYESRALMGARATLTKNPCPIQFEYSFLPQKFLGDSNEEMVSLIYGLGYRAWSLCGKYVAETPGAMLEHYPAETSYDILLIHRSQR